MTGFGEMDVSIRGCDRQQSPKTFRSFSTMPTCRNAR